MPTRSIIDIEINDGAFKRFADMFKQYEAANKKIPKEWAAVAEQQEKIRRAGKNTIAGMQAQADLLKKMNSLQQYQANIVTSQERSWANISRYVRQSSVMLLDTARSIVKWTTFGAGAIVGGTLFGLDRLASTVSSGRKSSLGLGVSYGQQRSFGVNYDRLVGSSDQFLAAVNEARLDPTKLGALLAAGGGSITSGDVANKNSAELAVQLIGALKKRVDNTPDQLLGSIPGASAFGDVAFLKRLKSTSAGELGEYGKSYGAGVGAYNLQERTQKSFQDFLVKLEGAGLEIEKVFVTGLEPLTGPINELGHSLADTLKTFIETGKFKQAMTDLGDGIKTFAGYLTSDTFKQDVKSFADGVGKLASGIEWLVGKFPASALAKTATIGGEAAAGAFAGGTLAGPPGAFVGGVLGGLGGSLDAAKPGTGTLGYGTVQGLNARRDRHNPGNIRNWTGFPTQGGFAVFPDDATGIGKIAQQLKLYQGRGIDTAEGILSTYAPPGENNTEAYIKDVIKRVGITRTEHLDFSNQALLAKFVAAITAHEGSKPQSVDTVVTVLNNTGGNAIVTTSQLPH